MAQKSVAQRIQAGAESIGSGFLFLRCRSDALLVTHLPEYPLSLRIHRQHRASCWSNHSRATLFTDSRYTLQAREEVHDASIAIAQHGLIRALGEMLRRRPRHHAPRLRARAQVTVAQKDALQSLAGARVRWVAAPRRGREAARHQGRSRTGPNARARPLDQRSLDAGGRGM